VSELPANYPDDLEADVVLSDGGTVHVRPIVPGDSDALQQFHGRLSAETVYLRFFSPLPRLSPQLVEHFTNVDYTDRLALVAELGNELVAVARYDRLTGTADAEVAFVVVDAHQGRGLATIMLEHLAVAARDRGVERFVAETLPTNSRMIGVFRDAGFQEEHRFSDGVIKVSFPIEPTEVSIEARHERERRAAARSVRRLLAPASIAVIGASRQPGTIGHEMLRNLLRGGFEGPVYPVHPTARQVASVRAFPSVLDIPDEIDLAVIVVPADAVAGVVEECGRKKVGGLVVISSGFADRGDEGAAAERRLVELARRLGMRLIGPNCMGVVNTAPAVAMNATFAPLRPGRGRVAFSSQSGALGVAILDALDRIGLGVSTFVSLGNRGDVSSNDLLQYWEGDDDTDVVLLYLERFGNPRTFARVARRLSRQKPIVAVKSARRPSAMHRPPDAGDDVVVDALFRQTGVIRVDTVEQLFDVAQVLVHQPLPAGRRVAIVGNGGGPSVLAADTCETQGMAMAPLADATVAALGSLVPGGQLVENPVDLGSEATADAYEGAVTALLADDSVDAVIVIFVPPLAGQTEAVAAAIERAAATAGAKPVLANFMADAEHGTRATPSALVGPPPVVPSFRWPESAALALARVADFADWRRRPQGVVPALADVDQTAAAPLVHATMDRLGDDPDGVWLDADATAQLLTLYGVAVGGSGAGVEGVETVVGVVQDPSFGPLLVLGVAGFAGRAAGRAAFELLGDRAYRVLPLTDADARELVRSVRGAPLLFGHAGSPPGDTDALEDVLLRVGRLAEDHPEVAEIDMRVVVSSAAAAPVDARVRLAPWVPHPELAVRRLR
jgi:acyl-CoA synthetase (NDP forming)/RimJ/RimL family protein N-acetyltransferase